MPGWMQTVVSLNPVTHLTTASRGLMHGQAVEADILWVLVAAVVLTVVFAPVAMVMYRRER
jgi:ABC-2 type transport system permease protein